MAICRGKSRRRFPRYGVGSLRVWLHRSGFATVLGKRVEVMPIDFNAVGMAFRCLRPLSSGERVVCDFVKDHQRAFNVVAVVRDITRLANHCRCGVEFDFEANDHMRSPEIRESLKGIELLLRDVMIVG